MADLSGLDDFNVSSLMDSGNASGGILYAPIDKFVEDPDNARQQFDQAKLEELADSMKQVNPATGKKRGVLEPLACKEDPDGKLIVLGGNRRFRAAKLAELEQLPYIIQDSLDDFDKFVLNDQRENLSPLEIAMFIKARIDDGHKKGDIAKALGRKASYVSDHAIFFDMAPVIRDLYDSGLCSSMQALALLHRGHKTYKEPIEQFCQKAIDEKVELTTSRVQAFLAYLKDQENKAAEDPAPIAEESVKPTDDTGHEPEEIETVPSAESDDVDMPTSEALESQADALLDDDKDKIKKAIIQVKHDKRPARLLTDRRAAYGLAWIKYDDDGHEIEVDLNKVSLVAIIEG